MKKGLHPEYYEAEIKCACGSTFTSGSTQKEIHVEICSQCHPFFTGKQKLVDTAGRVERFNRKFRRSAAEAEETAAKDKPVAKAKAETKAKSEPTEAKADAGEKKETEKEKPESEKA